MSIDPRIDYRPGKVFIGLKVSSPGLFEVDQKTKDPNHKEKTASFENFHLVSFLGKLFRSIMCESHSEPFIRKKTDSLEERPPANEISFAPEHLMNYEARTVLFAVWLQLPA